MIRKKQLLTATLALGLSAGLASGQIVLIDFGSNTGTPPASANWNNINGTGTFQLQDTAGNANVLTAVLSGTFSTTDNATGWTNRTEVPSWATGLVNEVLNDRLFQGNNQSGTFTLSGLDANFTYNIELAASFHADSGNAGRAPGFVSLVAGNSVVPVNARANPADNADLDFNATQQAYEWTVRSTTSGSPNNEGWIGLYGVQPDANGQIAITFAGAGNTLSRGAWNAMEITVIPEPSTYAALFGLLGLGLAYWVRLRRA
jgi:hypothetical protein